MLLLGRRPEAGVAELLEDLETQFPQNGLHFLRNDAMSLEGCLPRKESVSEEGSTSLGGAPPQEGLLVLRGSGPWTGYSPDRLNGRRRAPIFGSVPGPWKSSTARKTTSPQETQLVSHPWESSALPGKPRRGSLHSGKGSCSKHQTPSPSQLVQMLLTGAPPGPTRPSSSCSLMHSW